MIPPPPTSTLFPYTTLFRSGASVVRQWALRVVNGNSSMLSNIWQPAARYWIRSEEHTSELQSRFDLECRLLLEKKNSTPKQPTCSTTPYVIGMAVAMLSTIP